MIPLLVILSVILIPERYYISLLILSPQCTSSVMDESALKRSILDIIDTFENGNPEAECRRGSLSKSTMSLRPFS